MPYALSASSIRHWYRWQGLEPSWEQVAAGLAFFPQTLYMALCSVPPFFTASVLLLDAAPAVPNVVVGGLVTVVVAVVGWLLNRAIANSDANQAETKDAVRALTALVTEMRLERKDDRQLTVYLKERQDKLEHENETLRTSISAFDKYLAVQIELKKQHPSP